MARVRLSTAGRVVGQHHHRAQLTDGEVDMLLRLREKDHWSYARLAEVFEVSASCVAMIVTGRRRGQVAVRATRRKG